MDLRGLAQSLPFLTSMSGEAAGVYCRFKSAIRFAELRIASG